MSQPRDHWSSNTGLVLAATGSAIGLGNLWKFPFITWENDGGAFVLVYLVCIAAVGLPIMMAELLIGRRSQKSAVGALKEAVASKWPGGRWLGGLVGGWGVLAGFILLSYYTVIAGWSLFYFVKTVGWTFGGYPAGMSAGDLFGEQALNTGLQLLLSLGFSLGTIAVVYFGVSKGIERIARIFLPILFGILLLMLVSALGMSGSGEALGFIFRPNFSELGMEGILEALGHSFFTLSLGMGAMITYGSYVSRKHSVVKAAGAIVALDTVIALVATVIMFSVIFSVAGMREEVSGSTVGMLFISLPELFYSEVPFGVVLGPLFYVLVALAALTSTISLLEVVSAYLIDQRGNRAQKGDDRRRGRDLRVHHLRCLVDSRASWSPLGELPVHRGDLQGQDWLVRQRRPLRLELDAADGRVLHYAGSGLVHDPGGDPGRTRRRKRTALVPLRRVALLHPLGSAGRGSRDHRVRDPRNGFQLMTASAPDSLLRQAAEGKCR